MAISFEVSTILPATPAEIYRAWLDSEAHAAMTGGAAHISPEVGGSFTAWDGYIQGVNLELVTGYRILQSWRTTEFGADQPDSQLEVVLEPVEAGTRLTLRHSQLPPHGMQYEQGWVESYFEPMQAYFSA